MSALLQWFTSPEWAQVVKALLHSLWQGALIAVLLAIFLRRVSDPVARYRSALAALALMVFATVVTWAIINAPTQDPALSTQPPLLEPSAPDPVAAPELHSGPATLVIMRHKTADVRWTAWLAFVWLAGALLMLARAGFKVASAEQLRRSCRPLDDSRIEALLTETRRALGIANQIRVGVTDRLTSPAVVGVVVPMLILPLSLLTALTPEQIRFVLLHELAHIRRHDYLANLFQFVAESLLFFNPAVWWISHQIRREREACCDALATELSGAPADYAKTLVHVAERVLYPAPAAAPAFGNKREPSSLAERIQRLLVPGYRPSLRLTWRAMLAALIFGSILLFLSAVGTRLTVAAILTPQQRIDVIEKKMTEYGQKPEGGAQAIKGPVFVTAHVRTPDGSPLPDKMQGTIYEKSGNSSSVSSLYINKDGAFGGNAPHPGEIWVGVYVDGFAPAIAGPFDASDTNRLDAGELILNRGFDVIIRITDAASGKPLPNAALLTQFWLPGASSTSQEPENLKADSNGEATLHHCADQPLSIVAKAPGHEIIDKRFENVHPDEPIELKLRTGAQIAGIVTDKSTGRPIAGATVRIVYQKGSTTRRFEWNDPIGLLATTGDDGRYVANQLQPATTYWLGVSAPEHESIILSNLLAAGRDVNARLGPELIVRGQVLGDVKSLGRINDRYAFYREWIEQFDNDGMSSGELVPLEDANGVTRFEFTNRTAGTARLVDGKGRPFERQVDAPINDWVIDLNAVQKTAALSNNVPKREVIFRFKDPSGGLLMRGTVSVQIPNDVDPRNQTAHMEDMEITNGEVRAQIPIGGSTAVEPKQMIGYWFSRFGLHGELNSIDVSNGSGPIVIDVPILPAGAIYAKARNADGTPAGGLLFGVEEVKRAPDRSENVPFTSNDSTSDNLPRKWVSPPLPLGGTYRITGWRASSFCISQPVTVTGENPTAEVELQFPPGNTFEGLLLDANGQTIANAKLKPEFILMHHSSFGLNPVFTDDNGHFRMENMTPGVGDYTIEADVPEMTAERVKLDFNRQPQTIRLERGRRIAGYLVESNTSNIIPGAQIRAVVLGNDKLTSLTTQTEADGHFEFTQAGKGDYTFFLDCGVPASQQTYRGNVDTNITLAVKLYPWSKLKPKPPSTSGDDVALPKPGLNPRTNIVYASPQRQKIYEKLNNITLDSIGFTNLELSEVVSILSELTARHDPAKVGLNFLISHSPAAAPTDNVDLTNVRISLNPGLKNVQLMDVLEAIVKSADHPIKYSLLDYGVIFSFKNPEVPELFTRAFKVDSSPFFKDLQNMGLTNWVARPASATTDIQIAVIKFFDSAGVKIYPPKSVFFNDRNGTLIVHATASDLDAIEKFLSALNIQNGAHNLPNPNVNARPNPIYISTARQKVYEKLNDIRFDRIDLPDLPLSEAVRILTEQVERRDPEKEGINFIISKTKAVAPTPAIPGQPAFDPTTGQPITPTAPTENIDLGDVRINLDPGLRNVRLMDVLEAIVKTADHPIKYSMLDYGIEFSFKGPETPELFTRTFKVDPNTFYMGLQNLGAFRNGANSTTRSTTGNQGLSYMPTPAQSAQIQTAVVNFFAAVGVSLAAPKTVFYNVRQSTLTAHASAEDLDLIEAALDTLNIAPPEVNLKVRAVEVNPTDNKALGFQWYLGNFLMDGGTISNSGSTQASFTNTPSAANPKGTFPGSAVAGTGIAPSTTATNTQPRVCGILTNPQFNVILNALEQRGGAELLSEADATTLSGKQVQFVQFPPDLQKFQLLGPTNTPGNPDVYNAKPVGITLDVTPSVAADGATIQMTLVATVREFTGYNSTGPDLDGVSHVVPTYHEAMFTNNCNLWDGQTVVFGMLTTSNAVHMQDKVPLLADLPFVGRLFTSNSSQTQRKNVIMFVTPTVVHPATNSIHSEDYYDGGPGSWLR